MRNSSVMLVRITQQILNENPQLPKPKANVSSDLLIRSQSKKWNDNHTTFREKSYELKRFTTCMTTAIREIFQLFPR